jgi:hypothetical protein
LLTIGGSIASVGAAHQGQCVVGIVQSVVDQEGHEAVLRGDPEQQLLELRVVVVTHILKPTPVSQLSPLQHLLLNLINLIQVVLLGVGGGLLMLLL